MEKNMEHKMEPGGIWGFKGISLSYYGGESLLYYHVSPLW